MHFRTPMSVRIRHCVECPHCHTSYLIAFSPYRNRSYLVRTTPSSDEYTLYCFCNGANQASICRWAPVKLCKVSKPAHDRGYGSPKEVRPVSHPLQPDLSPSLSSYLSPRP